MKALKIVLCLFGCFVALSVIAGVSSESGRRELHHEVGGAVADSMIEQYDFLVKNGGSKMEICMQAGAVAYAYMNANDSVKYKTWKAVDKRDCARAGM